MRQCAIGLATSAGMSMNSVMVDVYPVGASSYLGGSSDSRLRRDRAARATTRARWHLDPSQPRPPLTATVRLISTKVSRRPETT